MTQKLPIIFHDLILKVSVYHILLIIRGEKVMLFHVFTFIPEKTFAVTTFMSFHSIYMHTLAKNLLLIC